MSIEKPRWLLIDDLRTVPEAIIARTYKDGKNAILNDGPWDCIIFDHDLGCKKTGYDLMCILEEHPELIPKNIIVITQNSVAKVKMELLKQKLLKRGLKYA